MGRDDDPVRYRMQDAGKTYFVYADSPEAARSAFHEAMGRPPETAPVQDMEGWIAKPTVDHRPAPGA
jgi:hypothetical protein